MNERIAIVGMACRYPDARSPEELWENALAQRRAFRRLPDERMRLEDYWSPDPATPDHFYSSKAALIEGYEFDRAAHRVAGSTYRSTDLTHWLALDVAGLALADAGFPSADGAPKGRTGVLVGNSLTGEFSRANLMRLRWPYVRRTVAAELRERGWSDAALGELLPSLERRYKTPFPPVDEDTLAGGLSNTIAGRICNHFDLGGGGYTVDGACSSSLLSVSTACRSLTDGDLDMAVAGGVDLSIDPFEIVGFARTGALATGEMRVYDRGSSGFWPGEGAGMVVLMRESDARAAGRRPYALVSGWGVSSDGSGGITRPEEAGYRRALDAAYAGAGFGPDAVGYFEGHGTGTPVGDTTELRALAAARAAAGAEVPAAIATIKGNIGHTKAAAGVAGLLEASMAVHSGVLPPTTGCVDPHPELVTGTAAGMLRVLDAAEPWPDGRQRRAGVTSMGFGGINAHVVLQQPDPDGPDPDGPGVTPPDTLATGARVATGSVPVWSVERVRRVSASAQDSELLLFDADTPADLADRLSAVRAQVGRMSYAELGDLATRLQGELADRRVRAAVVASSPESAQRSLGLLEAPPSAGGAPEVFDTVEGVFAAAVREVPRIGFLFPGQGSGDGTDGGALRRRFSAVDELYALASLSAEGDQHETARAQPRIVAGSLAGLRALDAFGIRADAAVGHSLGELTALQWAGAFDERTVLWLASVRGRAMSELGRSDGAMASVAAGHDEVRLLLAGTGEEPVVIAGLNGPSATVVSGPAEAVDRVGASARRRGLGFVRLPVSHAFHSPLVEPAAEELAAHLTELDFGRPRATVHSTVRRGLVTHDTDLRALLRDQVTLPVRFAEALQDLAATSDLLIEVGPGRVLTGLARAAVDTPVLSLETDGRSVAGVWAAVGAAYVLGAPVRHEALVADRLVRPLPANGEFRFFASPCEQVPELEMELLAGVRAAEADGAGLADDAAEGRDEVRGEDDGSASEDALELVRRLVGERVELPVEAVGDEVRLLDELHLSSITIGQIVNRAASELGLPAPSAPTAAANATVSELAASLRDLDATAPPDGDAAGPDSVAGIEPWIRAFALTERPAPVPAAPAVPPADRPGSWTLVGAGDTATDGVAERLCARLEAAGIGDGVLLWLPDAHGEVGEVRNAAVDAMLRATCAVFAADGPTRLAIVQRGGIGSAFARTLHLEAPRVPVVVVGLPEADPHAPTNPHAPMDPHEGLVDAVLADIAATDAGFREVAYDAEGGRRTPVLTPLPELVAAASEPDPDAYPVGPDDVLLVTGGGKGITSECALDIATRTGTRLGLIGRSDPDQDAELAANLERMRASGTGVVYARADLSSADQVRAAVDRIRAELGPVTGMLHGAGWNDPALLTQLDRAAFDAALAPKVDGLTVVLDALDADALRLLVAFGSIIGRVGLRGEAHYATANAWLTDRVNGFAAVHPECRCLALEWSVWSGVGMGERLGAVESLARDGITPISTDEGLAMFRRMLADPAASGTLIVTGRMDGLPTVAIDRPELPLLRFVDQPLVHYPGIELITRVELTLGGDPYLDDHALDGELLFPAVLGMEAMSQLAAAVTGRPERPELTHLEFLRPIAVPPGGVAELRLAALVRSPGVVDVAIRTAGTGYGVDHFRGTCRYPMADGERPESPAAPTAPAVRATEPYDDVAERRPEPVALVPLDPTQELYGGLFFQGKRFRRVVAYRELDAYGCVAELVAGNGDPWFGAFLPGALTLGDPGLRDAYMHGIQCCVPNATLLPAGVERIASGPVRPADGDRVTLRATERSRDGDTFVYDVVVTDEAGDAVLERWDGLRLRAVRTTGGEGPWTSPLLGAYLRRRIAELVPDADAAVVVEPARAPGGPAPQTAEAARRLFGPRAQVRHRPDGRPEATVVGEPRSLTAAHCRNLTLAVSGHRTRGCDAEAVEPRSTGDWRALLGEPGVALAHRVTETTGESMDQAATRVWTLFECGVKAGTANGSDELAAATLDGHTDDGWAVFAVGRDRVASLATRVVGLDEPVVFAIRIASGSEESHPR